MASDGNESEKPAPITRAPAIATGSPPVTAMSVSPIVCRMPAATAVRRGPDAVGQPAEREPREDDRRREGGEHRAPPPAPTSSRCRITKPASVA
jgi:hypothetical protein